ncbi:MAG: oxidoreductase [Actinobacteria bacterium]|nr:oxidoreductase [Actinomycetota bacterium]
MELFEVMRTSATTRYYRDDDVSEQTLYEVLDAARFAPSGGNRQGWHVVIVRDWQRRRTLRNLYLGPWKEYVAGFRLPGTSSTRSISKAAEDFAENLHEVPVHLIVCVRLDALAITDADLGRPSIVGGASVYPFVQNILLSCRNKGLGAALTTMICRREPEVKELLNIPEGFGIAGLLAVGRPEEKRLSRRLSRLEVSEFATQETFDGDPFDVTTS